MIEKIIESIRQVAGRFIEIVLLRLVLLIFWCVEVAEALWDKAKATNEEIENFVQKHDSKVIWSLALGLLVFCFFLIP
jgi:hypothetical protein